MPTTNIAGIKCKHAIVSDACRSNRGDAQAADEALKMLREEYLKLVEHWPVGKASQFHFVMTVDRP